MFKKMYIKSKRNARKKRQASATSGLSVHSTLEIQIFQQLAKLINTEGLYPNISFETSNLLNISNFSYECSKTQTPFKIKCKTHCHMKQYVTQSKYPFYALHT